MLHGMFNKMKFYRKIKKITHKRKILITILVNIEK